MASQLKSLGLTAQKAVDLAQASFDQCLIVAKAIERWYRDTPRTGQFFGGFSWRVSWISRGDAKRIEAGTTTLTAAAVANEERDPTRLRAWEIWAEPDLKYFVLSNRRDKWETRIQKMDLWELARSSSWKQTRARQRGAFASKAGINRMMIRVPHD